MTNWYKIKKIYVWDKQVRPATWNPWPNTIWYWTFDDQNANQITDVSWNNRNLTWWTMPTYSLVSWTNYAGNYSNVSGNTAQSWRLSPWGNYTLLVRVKPTTNSACYVSEIYGASWSIENQDSIIYWYNSGKFEFYTFKTNNSDRRVTIKSWASVNNWYLIWYTRSWTSVQTYANWQASWTLTLFSDSYGSLLYLWSAISWGRLPWQIWECVMENKVWTATEVLNYYNQTKSSYWL